MNILNFLTKGIFSTGKNVYLTVFCALFFALQIYAAPGRLDLRFPQLLASGANVTAFATQTDGKILIIGDFKTRGAIAREDVIRINADGTLDTTFNIGTGVTSPNSIRFIKLQTDGKILIAGYINQIGGTNAGPVTRLNTDGSVDTTFRISGIDVTFVKGLDIQTDGKVLISATNLIGSSFITRLKTDGSNDQGIGQPFFSSFGGFGYTVTFLSAENKILVGGKFDHSILKLDLNGVPDSTFSADIVANQPFDILVETKILASGKILVWGHFDTVNGATRRNIAVLNSNGSLDTTFNPATTGAEFIYDAVEQTNGKIIIGGINFPLNSLLHGNIARLNADGTIDKTFNQGRGANGDVNALKILPNNKLLIGGSFFRYHIRPRSGLAQIDL